MTTYTYTIRADGDISAGYATGVGNVRQAHLILPGSTVRGALAGAFARAHASADQTAMQAELDELFERALVVSQAVPAAELSLAAASFGRCKYRDFGGCEATVDDAFDALEGAATASSCRCEVGWEFGKGWTGGEHLRGARTSTQLTEHGRARTSALFTREFVRPDQREFTGTLTVRPGHELSQETIDWLASGIRLRLGGRRTVQGGAQFTARPADGHTAGLDALTRSDGRAVLRLASAAIVVDEFGAPTTDIGPALRALLGSQAQVEESRAWPRTDRITTWHARARLPRPVETALAAGSTWVVSGLPPDARALLAGGIGLRTGEGYGQAVVLEAPGDAERFGVPALGVTQPEEPEASVAGADTRLGQEDPADPAPEPRRSRTQDLMDDLEAAGRPEVIAKLWLQAKLLADLPPSHRKALRSGRADQALNYPWAQSLSSALRADIRALLAEEDDLVTAVAELDAGKGRS